MARTVSLLSLSVNQAGQLPRMLYDTGSGCSRTKSSEFQFPRTPRTGVCPTGAASPTTARQLTYFLLSPRPTLQVVPTYSDCSHLPSCPILGYSGLTPDSSLPYPLCSHSVNLPVALELKSGTSGVFLMQTSDGREAESRASAHVPTRSLLEAVLASSTQEKV